jgi:predicted  nucleic acid-binding Zn-ribbon protein
MNPMSKLLREIRERKQEIGLAMLHGSVKDMEHYKQLVGNVQAFQAIEDRINDLMQNPEEEI